jgi:hypothetical protein
VPKLVVHGALLKCSMGMAPGTLSVLPVKKTDGDTQPAASVDDYAPSLNVAPFGMCQSPSNPQVAAATAAAMGVLTPQPCMPVVTSPWMPGSTTVEIRKKAALLDNCKCMCQWAGVIEITQPGAKTIDIDG